MSAIFKTDPQTISLDEALALTRHQPAAELYAFANEVRKQHCSNRFDLCSIINARSGKCGENCKWCAQSGHHTTDICEYDLIDSKAAIDQALSNHKRGVHRFSFVTSGKAISTDNLDKLCVMYDLIKAQCDISLCASMGLLDKNGLQKLKDHGIVHYHCNVESSRSFFPQVCSSHSYDDKIATIKAAQEVGLKICSGGIIGMGETMQQRLEMAFELRTLGVLSIPVNVLMPIKGTALEYIAPLTDEEILVSMAMFRIINPAAYIRFAGGRVQFLHIQEQALRAGINASLVGDMLTTVGTDMEEDKRMFIGAGFDINNNNENN